MRLHSKPDKREFLKISQAVGVGFLVMGVIGYVVKLSTCLRHLLHLKGKGHFEADMDSCSSHPRQQHSRRWRIKRSLLLHTPPFLFDSHHPPKSENTAESDMRDGQTCCVTAGTPFAEKDTIPLPPKATA